METGICRGAASCSARWERWPPRGCPPGTPGSSWPPRRKARPRRRPPTIASSWASSASAARRAAACRSSASRAPACKAGQLTFTLGCDVDAAHRQRATEEMRKRGFKDFEAKTKDFRDLVNDKSLDCLLVATPDHWHAQVAIEAMQGRQGRLLREAADADRRGGAGGAEGGQGDRPRPPDRQPAAHRLTAACSAWRPSWSAPAASARSRRSSAASAATRRAARSRRRRSPRGWTGTSGSARPPKVPYRKKGNQTNCHYEFRWWYEYSGGKMTDWGAHHLDIAQWALDMDGSGPIAVEVLEGGRAVQGRRRLQLPPELQGAVHLRQRRQGDRHERRRHRRRRAGRQGRQGADSGPDGKPMRVGPDENGVLFLGEEGTIFVSRGTLLASDAKILSEPLKDDPKLYDGRPTNHMRNFLDCVKSRKQPICDVDGRRRLGDRLPHRRDRPADRQEAEVGPRRAPVRRRGGQQAAVPAAPRPVAAQGVTSDRAGGRVSRTRAAEL